MLISRKIKAVDVPHLMKMGIYGMSGDKSRLGSHITIAWFYALQEDERADAR